MKYSIVLLALLPFIFSCKTKSAVVQKDSAVKTADTSYVENPETGELTMYISTKNETPSGTWILQNINSNGGPELARISMELDFNSKSNKVSGNDGCNQYSGTFETGISNDIEFGPLAATKRACIIPADYAEEFYSTIQRVASYIHTGNNLILKNEKGMKIMQFVKKD